MIDRIANLYCMIALQWGCERNLDGTLDVIERRVPGRDGIGQLKNTDDVCDSNLAMAEAIRGSGFGDVLDRWEREENDDARTAIMDSEISPTWNAALEVAVGNGFLPTAGLSGPRFMLLWYGGRAGGREQPFDVVGEDEVRSVLKGEAGANLVPGRQMRWTLVVQDEDARGGLVVVGLGDDEDRAREAARLTE